MSFSIENFLIVLLIVIVLSFAAIAIYDWFGGARYRWTIGGFAMPQSGPTAAEYGGKPDEIGDREGKGE